MGKVLKAVAVVGVAVAIASFAPQLTPTFLAHAFGQAAASSIVAATLSFAASTALQAISSSPMDPPSGYRRSTLQQEPGGWRMIEVPPAPASPEVLQPIAPSWRHAFFWPLQCYAIIRLAGDCMRGVVDDNIRWAVISRYDPIRPGDLFAFDLDDLWSAYRPEMRFAWWWRLFNIGMVKRYVGTEREWGRLIFDCTNPPTICETGFGRVRYAYRVLSWHESWWSAQKGARRSALLKHSCQY